MKNYVIKLRLDNVAKDLAEQLKELVPVRTGRLKNSIKYNIEEKDESYVITLTMEDYFKWLKPRTKPQRLPSPRELEMAKPPLPKMNSLGVVKTSELSPRSQGILSKLDVDGALEFVDMDYMKKIIINYLNL